MLYGFTIILRGLLNNLIIAGVISIAYTLCALAAVIQHAWKIEMDSEVYFNRLKYTSIYTYISTPEYIYHKYLY